MYGRIFTPFTVGPFTIVPEGEQTQGSLPIILGKKGAFGSGDHETTAACLEELALIPGIGDCSVLDLGSGTGILSVAALRLGASRAVAVDIDPAAAESCRQNVALNGMEKSIETICGDLATAGDTSFDILLANIYAEIHLALAEEMVARTRPGGHLVLSGIPLQDKYDIWKRFTSLGCDTVSSRIGEDYATYVMRKGAA